MMKKTILVKKIIAIVVITTVIIHTCLTLMGMVITHIIMVGMDIGDLITITKKYI